MKKLLFILIFSFITFNTFLFSQILDNKEVSNDVEEQLESNFSLTQGFEENKGQIFDENGKFRSDVYFVANLSGANVFFTDKGVVLYFKSIEPSEYDKICARMIPNPYSDKEWEEIMKQINNREFEGDLIKAKSEAYRIDINFPDANFNIPFGQNEILEKRNYFNPQHPDGLMDVPVFESIRYVNLYPGIDIVFYIKSGKLKYDFELSAGADPSLIKILYKGQENVSLDVKGNAIVKILLGEIVENKPICFQGEKPVEAEFVLSNDTILFQLNKYDQSKPITIDPSLTWSTYFHDGKENSAAFTYTRPVWDSKGNMFIVQNTYNNTVFPIISPGGSYAQSGGNNGLQLTIMKFNANKQIVWSTYYASSQSAQVKFTNQSAVIDKDDNLYIIGSVFYVYGSPSPSFPLQSMPGAYYETEQNNNRNFILKFTSEGERLWATMFNKTSGTSSSGLELCGIAIDNNNRLVVTGETYTPPSWNPMPLVNPGGSHYFKNTSSESSVPTLHRFSSTGVLEWSTYICQGNSSAYNGNYTAIDVDKDNNIFIGGSGSGSYTTVNPGGAYVDGVACGNGRKIQIFKFASNGSLNWCTLYGGVYISGAMLWQDCRDLKIAANGDLIIVGRANATNFPFYNPGGGAYFKNTLSSGSSSVCDGVILQFSNGGVRKWATFIGGDGTSDGTNLIGLGIDSKNNIFISGSSRTTNTFPTQYLAGSYNQSSQTSDYAVVLSQFNINGVMLWSSYFGNKTWTSSGGFGLYSDICETKMVQCGMAYPDYPIPTIDPGGGAYFHSTSEGLTGQTDFISEFNIYSSSPTPPTSASASPNFVCPGVSTNITLTASGGNPGDGGLTEWFTGDCGTNLIGTGNPLVIPQTLNSNTTYYVRYSGTCGITECVSTIVSVKTDVGISSVSAGASSICPSETTQITANGIVGTGANLTWFTGPGGTGTNLGSNNPLTVAAGTYYARITGDCGSPAEKSITITEKTNVGISSVNAGASSICPSETTQITANGIVGTGANLTWFTGPGGTGTNLGSNNPLTVVAGTYYARITGDCGSPAEKSITITEKINVGISSVNAGASSVCPSETTQITANGIVGTGANLTWFTGPGGTGTNLGSNNPLTVAAGTYYARISGDCGSPAEKSITIIENPIATAPTNAFSDQNNICSNSPTDINLSVTGGSGGTLAWFTGSCGGTEIGTGNPIAILSSTTTTTYYARWENSCGVSDCVELTVNIIDAPTAPDEAIVDRSGFCANDPGNIELSVNGGYGNNVHWFVGSCGGTSVGIGNPLIIPSPETTTTYYARWENSCGVSTCINVLVEVNDLPSSPSQALVDRNNVCVNDEDNIELSVTGGNGNEVHWFTTDCGNTEIGTGNPLVIPSPIETTIYFARWENDCGFSSCKSVQLNVIQLPIAPTSAIASVNNVCSDSNIEIELSAIGGSGENLRWFTESCGGNDIGINNPLSINSPTETTEYFVRWENSCGLTDCKSVIISTIEVPGNPNYAEVSNENICVGELENITLTLVGDYTHEVKWYSGTCGGNLVGAGNPLTITAPNISTVYFARYESSCGNSECVSIAVNVNNLPNPPSQAFVDRNNICDNDEGNIELSVTDGQGENLFWYTNACGDTFIGTGNPLIINSPTESTTYFARWENICGQSVCQNISVNIIPVPNTTINPAGPFCTSDENIVLTASESGGIWSGNGIVNENVGLFSPYLAGQGEHIITYTITGECSSSSQIIISVYDIFDASITSEKDFCYSENNIELTSASLGGIWQGNAVNPNTGILNIQQAGIGTHEIIYSKDGLCGDADTIYITIHPQANASIFAVDTLYDKDKPVYVETLEEGGVWSGVGITENGWFYPEISGPGEFEIIYTIQTICGDADTIIVYVLKSPIADLFIPNAITPDGDGHNDKWEILGIEAFDIVSINIFTRWGDEVFVFYGSGTQYMNPINQWEGKYKNKELPSGTYLYILKLNNKDTYKGTISLIR